MFKLPAIYELLDFTDDLDGKLSDVYVRTMPKSMAKAEGMQYGQNHVQRCKIVLEFARIHWKSPDIIFSLVQRAVSSEQ